MNANRYTPAAEYLPETGEYIGSMDELPDGEYVAFADYDRLQRELAYARSTGDECALEVDGLRRGLTDANALLREAPGMQWKSDVEYADWRRRINEHLGGEREDNR